MGNGGGLVFYQGELKIALFFEKCVGLLTFLAKNINKLFDYEMSCISWHHVTAEDSQLYFECYPLK